MSGSCITLSSTLRKNSHDYKLYQRNDFAAIYVQRYENKFISYEVFKIKIEPDKIIFGKLIPAREKFPSDEDFGYTAWTCHRLEKAKKKFLEISEKRSSSKH